MICNGETRLQNKRRAPKNGGKWKKAMSLGQKKSRQVLEEDPPILDWYHHIMSQLNNRRVQDLAVSRGRSHELSTGT